MLVFLMATRLLGILRFGKPKMGSAKLMGCIGVPDQVSAKLTDTVTVRKDVGEQ